MLRLTVPGSDEFFDEETNTFVTQNDFTIHLEHSLVSLSKWESKFEKPFLSSVEKTTEETIAYIGFMIIDADFPPEVFSRLTSAHYDLINEYLDSKQTATWFSEPDNPNRGSEIITSELIYYWLVTFNIPFQVETWHLNRLFTLLKVFNVKNAKPKKMSRSELAERNRKLNEQRKAKHNTTG